MKRRTKLWLLAAAGLILAGLVLLGITLGRNGWDLAAASGAEYVTSTVELREDFRDIEISFTEQDVILTPSEDGRCRVVFYEREGVAYTAAVRGGTLRIERNEPRSPADSVTLLDLDGPSVTLYLPEGDYGALTLEGHTGNVRVPEGFRFARVDVTASTGDVDCRASCAGLLRIALSTGDIRVEKLTAGELELSVSTGRIELSGVDCAGRAALVAGTGKVFLTDLRCGSLDSSGSTGSLTMERVTVAETISIRRGAGDVSFTDCDAAELSIQTTTGDVTGTLRTEKIFLTDTHTGRVEVPRSVTGGKCEITTGTGDIRIEIAP